MSDINSSNATAHTLQEPTPDELRPEHYTILRLLLHKPCYAAEIRRFTSRSINFILQQLKHLLAKGLITRHPDPFITNRIFYQLTENGYHAISHPPQSPKQGLTITIGGKGWAYLLLTHIADNTTNVANIAKQLNWCEETTSLRIQRLQDHDLLIATSDLLDSRIKYYQLTPKAIHLFKLPSRPLKDNTALTIQNHTIIQNVIRIIHKSSGIAAVKATRLLKYHKTYLQRILHLLRKLKLLKALNDPKIKRLRYTLTNHGLHIAQQTGILPPEKEGESDE